MRIDQKPVRTKATSARKIKAYEVYIMQLQTLRLGDAGPLVGFLQLVLKRLGFYSGKINYKFDGETERAVAAFQSALGLSSDGTVGQKTRAALEPYFTGNYRYTVREGDTLFSIASKSGSNLKMLLAANDLADPDNLFVGQRIIVPFSEFVVPATLRFSSDVMNILLGSLCARYPFLSLFSIGRSALGKDIAALRLGRGEKVVSYNASHHANEWITSLLLVKFVEMFCHALVTESRLGDYDPREVFDSASIYIVPMVDPDGVDLVTGQIAAGSELYKNAEKLNIFGFPFPDGWKANIEGTDLNLNYPAGWEQARRIKFAQGFTSPAPRDFVGEYPLSAPESRAMAQFTKNLSPRLILAYHSQGEIIYWKFADYDPPRGFEIAQRFSAVSGYSVETTPENSGYAGYKDWFIQENNLPGYTIEVGRGASPLPLEQFPKILSDNLGILMLAPLLA